MTNNISNINNTIQLIIRISIKQHSMNNLLMKQEYHKLKKYCKVLRQMILKLIQILNLLV